MRNFRLSTFGRVTDHQLEKIEGPTQGVLEIHILMMGHLFGLMDLYIR